MHGDRTYFHQVADLVVQSNLAFPAYTPAPIAVPDWTICVMPESSPGPRPEPQHIWYQEPGHRPWLRFALIDGTYHLSLPEVADVLVSESRREMHCYPVAGAVPDLVMVAIQNQILPLAIGLSAWVVHASAVADRDETVLFVGVGGSGKSTLAAYMHRRGWRLLADDATILRPPWNAPVPAPLGAAIRLCEDSLEAVMSLSPRDVPRLSPRSGKYVVPFDSAPQTPVPAVGRIYLLDDTEESVREDARSEPIGAVDATLYLLQCTFLLKVNDATALRGLFERITDIVARVPIRRLRVPNRYDALPDVARLIDADRQRA